MRALLSFLFLLCLAQAAQAQPQISGDCPLNASSCLATATGGTAAQTAAARAGQLLTPQDLGAPVDTQQAAVAATTASGGSALAVGTAIFGSADCAAPAAGCTGTVNKNIVVQGAGTSSALGSITSVPVTGNGTAYTSQPTCAITDANGSPGTYAVCVPQMSVTGATIVAGGTGFAINSTFNVTLKGNLCQTAPVLSVSTNGSGVITTVNSVVTAGLCTNPPLWFSAFLTVGKGATFNLTQNVGGIAVISGGVGYHAAQTTAALTGGNPGGAATLGTPVVSSYSTPYAGTITGFTDTRHVTVSGTFGTTLTGTTEIITWGHDDGAAINAAMAQVAGGAPSPNSGTLFFPSPPAGRLYGIATPLVKPAWPITLFGGGRGAATIVSLASAAALLTIDDSTIVGYPDLALGGGILNMTLDGNDLASTTLDILSMRLGRLDNLNIRGAATFAQLALSRPANPPNTYEMQITNVELGKSDQFVQNMYGDPALMPLYGLYNGGSDNHFVNVVSMQAMVANFYDPTAGESVYIADHAYGYPFGYYPSIGFALSGAVRLEGSTSDGAGASCINITSTYVSVIGNHCTLVSNNATGINVASTLDNSIVALNRFTQVYPPTGGGTNNLVNVTLTPSQTAVLLGNPGATQGGNFTVGTGGYANGDHSIAIGYFAQTFGKRSTVMGDNGDDFLRNSFNCWGGGGYANTAGFGTIQHCAVSLSGASTSNVTPANLTSDNAAIGGFNEYNLRNNNTTALLDIRATAVCNSGDNAAWTISGLKVTRKTGVASITFDGVTPSFAANAGNTAGSSTWAPAVVLDTTNGGVYVTGLGACASGATTVQWNVEIQGVENFL